MTQDLLIGGEDGLQLALQPKFANRHGLIAGATGTGKTVTLQVLAEGFSRLGVPVFLADVKGDLSGLCCAGTPHPKIDARVSHIGIPAYQQQPSPVAFWDLFGERGVPVRTSICELGPQLLAALLELNETQESILTLAFDYADNEGLLLVDLNDLRSTLNYLADHGRDLGSQFAVSRASVNAILRRLLMIEREGGDRFFGEPALQLQDLLRTTLDGRGIINLLAAEQLIQSPRIYSTFLLWLLAELFEQLPEVGDPEQPILVFFFDEAHLLFRHASRALLEKIEQLVRLIRSKGVGVYFITQSPADIPDSVLSQLGNRIQHALRAYTPKEQKAVRVAAQSFRPNPTLDTEAVISTLGVGEALVSVLGEGGVPTRVERILVAPPASRIGPATEAEREAAVDRTLMRRYREPYDPHSAHEEIRQRLQQATPQATAPAPDSPPRQTQSQGRTRESAGEAFLKSVARSVGSSLGHKLIRGLLGSLLR